MKTGYTIIISALMLVLCPACNSNAKKLRLEPESLEAKESKSIENPLLQSKQVLDTIIPNVGIKYEGSRKINPQQSPVTFDFTGKLEVLEPDMSDYFSSVKYIRLKYPYPDKGSFLSDAKIHVAYNQGSSSTNGFNSSVWFTSGNIIAGDPYMGYHCYDSSGAFLYTIAAMDELPDYDKTNNRIEIAYNPDDKYIQNFSVYKDNCLILEAKSGKTQFSFYNLTAQNAYLTRPLYRGRNMRLLSPELYADYVYSVMDTTKQGVFIYIFDVKGDTICRFINYNPKPELKKSANTNPDHPLLYYYDDILTVRQAYNDTVYRVKSASELEPAYILNFGTRKLDVQTALYGDKAGKLIPNTWVESKKFVLFTYTENYDCINCRKNETVHFFYSLYDKQSKQLYQIPTTNYPEDYWMKSSLDESIPFPIDNIRQNASVFYVTYSKKQLESMIKYKNFATVSATHQEKMKKISEEMDDSELLIMILE